MALDPYAAATARMSPQGWVATATRQVRDAGGERRWIVPFVHGGGFLAIEVLTDDQVADWAPLLPRWSSEDDECEPDAVIAYEPEDAINPATGDVYPLWSGPERNEL